MISLACVTPEADQQSHYTLTGARLQLQSAYSRKREFFHLKSLTQIGRIEVATGAMQVIQSNCAECPSGTSWDWWAT
jgi:hypothetical protein